MSHNYENDWENVKNSTYDVVVDQNGRGASYEETVAGTLGVKAQYLNWLQVGSNSRSPLYDKVAEILDLWKDDKNAARASRFDLIEHLEKHQKANSCNPLIFRLKEEHLTDSMQGQFTTKSSSNSPHFQSKQNYIAPHVQGYGNVTVQKTGNGNFDNRNYGVGYVSGNGNTIAGYSAGNEEKAENDGLQDLMKSHSIGDLYTKFRQAGITVPIIWDLDEAILDEDIKLTRIEKLKYQKEQKKQQS